MIASDASGSDWHKRSRGEDERTKIEENVEDIPSDDDEYLTKLLADFQS